MKKLYSTMMMLAMMVAALSFNACGGDDGNDVDNGGGGSGSSSFSITRDGKLYEIENVSWLNPLYTNGGQKQRGNHFSLEDYPAATGQIHIIFPYSQYGENLPPSYFYVGYSDFDDFATDIKFIASTTAGWNGEYTSGSAKVTKNDGKNITIQFSNYSFEVKRSGHTRSYVLNGTLTFMAYLYE